MCSSTKSWRRRTNKTKKRKTNDERQRARQAAAADNNYNHYKGQETDNWHYKALAMHNTVAQVGGLGHR